MSSFCVFTLSLILSMFADNSQQKVSGFVKDKNSGEALPYAIVMDDKGKVLSQTDRNGRFSVEISLPATLSFIHLAYDSISIRVEEPTDSCCPALEPHLFGLDEVVVISNYANELLAKAYSNLINRLEKKHSREYCLYNKERISDAKERETFALVDATIHTIDKKKRIKWDLYLKGFGLIKNTDDKYFKVNGKHFFIPFLFDRIRSNIDFSDCYCEITERDESFLTIKATPKHPDKNNYVCSFYTIDMSDTVIVKTLAQAFPDSRELSKSTYKGGEYNFSNAFRIIEYDRDEASRSIFLSEIQLSEVAHIENDSAKYDIFFQSRFSLRKKEDENKITRRLPKKKKIQPYTYSVYEVILRNL